MQAPSNQTNQSQTSTEDVKASLVFGFQIVEQKLVVKAQSPKTLYSCTINPDPALSFDILKDFLNKRFFIVSNANDDSLKILVGFTAFQFKSVQSIIFDQFKAKIQTLENKLSNQQTKNAQFQGIIKTQQSQIHSLTSNFTQLTERLSQLQQINREHKQKFNKVEIVTSLYKITFKLSDILKHSQVVKTAEEAQTLQEFFGNKKIHFLQMLYRATEQQFKVDVFHDKCDYIQSTLTVCETEFGKKIGGYNPQVWSAAAHNTYRSTSQSFIFSLTNKHKFEPNQAANAIYNHQYGPRFGSAPDLYINNSANTSVCYSNINSQYMNKNYTKDDAGSWKRFTGHTGDKEQNYFKLKEWQVWRVVFERESEKLGE